MKQGNIFQQYKAHTHRPQKNKFLPIIFISLKYKLSEKEKPQRNVENRILLSNVSTIS